MSDFIVLFRVYAQGIAAPYADLSERLFAVSAEEARLGLKEGALRELSGIAAGVVADSELLLKRKDDAAADERRLYGPKEN